MELYPDDWGFNLKKLRKREHLTQAQLADKLHVSQQTISKWETGENPLSAEAIVIIAKFFSISCDKFLIGGETKNLALINKTGLTNNTLNTLQDLNRMAKDSQNQEKEYYTNLIKTIDILVSNQGLLSSLSGYFFHDFSELNIVNEKTFLTVSLTTGGTFTINDNANLLRLRIMDKLKETRESLKEGRK